ncbi:hypothetical protein, partial [Treponema sp. J25]|uniref:hypothetical protein n=1 Tax=Treponema sp. J25 TaxID=2094121 RepID=UPI0010E8CAA3
MVFTLYTVPLFVAGGLCILVARYVQKHPEAPAARPFIFLMWLGVGCALCHNSCHLEQDGTGGDLWLGIAPRYGIQFLK